MHFGIVFLGFVLFCSVVIDGTPVAHKVEMEQTADLETILDEIIPPPNPSVLAAMLKTGFDDPEVQQKLRVLQYLMELRFRRRLESWIRKGSSSGSFNWAGCRRCFKVIISQFNT